MLLAALVIANPNLTLDVPADRLLQALATLGKATGLQLECAPNLVREVVVMHIESRPKDEVLAQFAAAMDAEWKPIDGGFRLVRSAERVQALRDAQRAREAAIYAEWMRTAKVAGAFDANGLAKRMVGVVQAYRPRQDLETLRKADREGPAHRALLRALQAVGSGALAALPVGGRAVYASRPTLAQRPLNAQAILQGYANERQAWVDAAKRHGVHPPRVGGSTVIPAGLLSKLQPSEPPARLLLELSRHSRGASVAAYLKLVDGRGRVMDKASLSPGLPLNETETGKTPLPLSPDAIAIQKFWTGGNTPGLISDALRARLADPVRHEPLQIVPGDLLPKIARRRGASLIAPLTDTLFMMGLFSPKGAALTEEGYVAMLANGGVDLAQNGDWLLGRISDPVLRDVQVDRQILGEFARLPLGEGLEVAADWSARLPSTLDNFLPLSVRQLVLGQSDPTFNGNDPRTLRFYGTLSRDQRKAAQRGVSLGSLTALQRERLQPLLNLIGPLEVEGPRPEDRDDDSGDGDILGEPTEALPNGIPRDGMLVIDRTQREVVMARQQNSSMDAMALSARELVDQEIMAKTMRAHGFGGIDLQSLQPAEQESLQLRFRLTETVSALRRLSASRARGERGDLTAMPPAFRSEVERLRERYRKMMTPGSPPP